MSKVIKMFLMPLIVGLMIVTNLSVSSGITLEGTITDDRGDVACTSPNGCVIALPQKL